MWNILCFCSVFLLLTEWVDIWLSTDLNTKRFSKPQLQEIIHLLGVTRCRVAQLQSRTEKALHKEKKYSKWFTSQGTLEKCASLWRPGVCLIQGLGIFSSHSRLVKRWKACAAEWVKSILSWHWICMEVPEGCYQCCLERFLWLVSGTASRMYSPRLLYSSTGSKKSLQSQGENIQVACLDLPQSSLFQERAVVKGGGLLVTLQCCLWGAHMERIRTSIGLPGLRQPRSNAIFF